MTPEVTTPSERSKPTGGLWTLGPWLGGAVVRMMPAMPWLDAKRSSACACVARPSAPPACARLELDAERRLPRHPLRRPIDIDRLTEGRPLRDRVSTPGRAICSPFAVANPATNPEFAATITPIFVAVALAVAAGTVVLRRRALVEPIQAGTFVPNFHSADRSHRVR